MAGRTETDARPEEDRFDSAGVLTLAAAHLLHDTYSSFLFPLLPLLTAKLSLSLTIAGTLTLFMRLPSLFQPFIGYVADRVNLRYFVILAPAITATVMSLIGLAPSLTVLILMVVVVGTSSATLHAPSPAVVSRLSGPRLGLGLAIYQIGGQLASALGPLVIVAAVSWWTLEGTYRLIPPGLLMSVLLYRRLRHVSFDVESTSQLTFGQVLHNMRPLLLPLTCIIVARALLSSTLMTYLPIYLDDQGASLWLVGGSLTILHGSGVAGVLIGGALSDRIGRRPTLFASFLIAPLLLLAFLAADGWQASALLALLGIAGSASVPVLMAVVLEGFAESRATANGVLMALSFVLSSLTTVAVGSIGDHWGLHSAFTWSALAAFSGVGFVFLLPIGKLQPQKPGI